MKSIIMLGGGIQQVPAVKRLQDIGYRVIVTDMNPKAPAFNIADVTVNIGANDIKSLISWIFLNKHQYNIAGIFTLTNYAVSVALAANACNLPSLSVETVVSCDNKLIMKRKFKEHGFLTAEFYEIKTEKEAVEAFENIRGNAYLKVVDGFGGKGVYRVTNADEIKSAFRKLQGNSLYPELILEQEIVGDFIDTQGVFYKNQFYPAGDADSFFSNNTSQYKHYNPVETFNICPSQQSSDRVKSAYSMLKDIAVALGMNFGPVGGDFVVNEKGVYVIEVGPRLHGPNGTLQMFPEALNIKPLEFMAQVLCGDEPNKDFVKLEPNAVALCNVFISNQTEINEVGFLETLNEIEGVFKSYVYKEKNKTLHQDTLKLSGLASVFVKGKNFSEANARLDKVKETFYVN